MESQSPLKQNVRFLIISDTHGNDFFGDDDGQRDPIWALENIPKADVVLHCGDLTNMGSIPDHAATLDMLSAFPTELKLVIAGNHDITLDEKASRRQPEMAAISQKALKMWTGKRAKEHGIVYLTEGRHTFTLKSGATFTIYASPYTPEFNNWAFGYAHDIDRFSALAEIGTRTPDIVMTHGPPLGYLDSAHNKHMGCPHLLNAVSQVQPRLHCFGHIHESRGACVIDWNTTGSIDVELSRDGTIIDISTDSKYQCGRNTQKTLAVNAALLDRANKPYQNSTPWCVELDL